VGPAAWVGLLILGTTGLRLLMAASVGLGVDESYMVAAGREIAWGYFDHPPLSWWLSGGAARLFGSEDPVAVRLPFILLFALTTWLMFRLAADLFGARAGLWAAVALNMAPVLGVTTGSWVLPDGPLVAALLGFGLCLNRALERGSWQWWLGAGVCAGLAMLSKYTAVLTFAGAFVAIATLAPRMLARPQPWVAGAVAVAVFSPVVIWNAANGWASFAFQGARAGVRKLDLAAPFVTVAGEALFLLPWIWLPLAVLWARALWRGPTDRAPWLLAWLGFGPIVLFVVISGWSPRVLYHWAAPGYLFVFPLLGRWVAEQLGIRPGTMQRAIAGTAVLLLVGLGVAATEMRLNLLALRGDPLRQGLDWTPLRAALAERGLLDRPIVGPSWNDTGKLAYALGGARPVFCLNADCRQFAHRSRTASDLLGQDVLILAPRQDEARIRAAYGPLFEAIETLPPVVFALPGRPVVTVGVHIGRGLRALP
jgi:4-amino-4-deoxy-L-arabinose transferase-like glycosyltransferase